jgi:hypothetical protein
MSLSIYNRTQIVSDSDDSSHHTGPSTIPTVHTDFETVYLFYVENTAVPSSGDGVAMFRKSTNSGFGFGSGSNLGITPNASPNPHRTSQPGVWYDKWTDGDTGDKIHVVFATESGHDDAHDGFRGIYYNYIDTADSDNIGTPVLIWAPASNHPAIEESIRISKAVDGTLVVVAHENNRWGLWKSTTDGASWTEWVGNPISVDPTLNQSIDAYATLMPSQDPDYDDWFFLSYFSDEHRKTWTFSAGSEIFLNGQLEVNEGASPNGIPLWPTGFGVVDPKSKRYHLAFFNAGRIVSSTPNRKLLYRSYDPVAAQNPGSYTETVLLDLTSWDSPGHISEATMTYDFAHEALYLRYHFGRGTGTDEGTQSYMHKSYDFGDTWSNRYSPYPEFNDWYFSTFTPYFMNGGSFPGIHHDFVIYNCRAHTMWQEYELPTVWYANGDWGASCELRLNTALVPAPVVDFTVLITEKNLPSEMLTATGPNKCKSDGSDIRFSMDSDGRKPLAREIVNITQSDTVDDQKAEIWVKIPLMNTDIHYPAPGPSFQKAKYYPVAPSLGEPIYPGIHIFYANASATEPTAASYEGQYNAWDPSIRGVWHCDSFSGDNHDSSARYGPTTKGIGRMVKASTGPSVTTTEGITGVTAFDFTNGCLSTDDPDASSSAEETLSYMPPNGNAGADEAQFMDAHLSMWFEPDVLSDGDVLFSWSKEGFPGTPRNCVRTIDTAGEHYLTYTQYLGDIPGDQFAMTTSLEDITGGAPYLLGFMHTIEGAYPTVTEAETIYWFLNGIQDTISKPDTWLTNSTDNQGFTIGKVRTNSDPSGNSAIDGVIDEIRIETAKRDTNWHTIRYNNEHPDTNGIFFTPQVPTDPLLVPEADPIVLTGVLAGFVVSLGITDSIELTVPALVLDHQINLDISDSILLTVNDISFIDILGVTPVSILLTSTASAGIAIILESANFDPITMELTASTQLLVLEVPIDPDAEDIVLSVGGGTLDWGIILGAEPIAEGIELTASIDVVVGTDWTAADFDTNAIVLTANEFTVGVTFPPLGIDPAAIVLTANEFTVGVTFPPLGIDPAAIVLTAVLGLFGDLGTLNASIVLTGTCDLSQVYSIDPDEPLLGDITLSFNEFFMKLDQIHSFTEELADPYPIVLTAAPLSLDEITFSPYIEYRLGLRQATHEGHTL